MEQFVGLHSGLETLIGETAGVRPMCPMPMLAPLPVFLCHLNGLFIRRWGRWIRLTDPPSTFVTVLYFCGHLFLCLPWFWMVSSPLLSTSSLMIIDTFY